MTADASAFSEALPIKDLRSPRAPEDVDTVTGFSGLRQRVAERIGAIKVSFDELRRPSTNTKTDVQSDIPQVDLRQEGTELDVLLKEQATLDRKTALAIEAESTQISQTPDPLTVIQKFMSEPTPRPLSKIEGATKTTRFLEREGRNWKDGIQVMLYHDNADTNQSASVENFALETDAKGRIIGRKSLHVMKDGTYTVRNMKMTGRRWVGRTHAASEHDVTQAIQAVDQLHIAEMSQHDDVQDNGRDEVVVPSGSVEPVAGVQLPDTETEIPYRREQIQAFAMDFLHVLNPRVSREALNKAFEGFDIFTDGDNAPLLYKVSSLRGYQDMFKLAKHYEGNLDDIPQSTIVLGEETVIGPLDTKALVYVAQFWSDVASVSDRVVSKAADTGDLDRILAKARKSLIRSKMDSLTIESGEDKFRPDVYIKNINDKTVGNFGTSVQKESFSLTGAGAVIIGDRIRPNISEINISCNGSLTVLPEASLTPPVDGNTKISLTTLNDVILPQGSTLAATTIDCDNFRLEGGKLKNPHPNERRVEVACNRFVDNSETPLDPQLFHINDEEYVERQTAIYEKVHSARLGIPGEASRSQLEMDRHEHVADFALTFFKTLNPDTDTDRSFMELFARGATGTKNAAIFGGTAEENIAQYRADMEGREDQFRGVEDMLQLVEYYDTHPWIELPTEVFVLGKENDVSKKIKGDAKTLVYWSESWMQQEGYTFKSDIMGKVSFPILKTKYLERPSYDKLTYNGKGKKKPDLFIGSKNRISKMDLDIQGFDNLVINAQIEPHDMNIVCAGELSILPQSSLVVSSEFSTINAHDITQRGDIAAARIDCIKYKREQGSIGNPKRIVKQGRAEIVCEEYIGEPPDSSVVDLITSPTL